MAAAVADYRPAQTAEHKMKKSGDGLVLDPWRTGHPARSRRGPRGEPSRTGQLLVGFAAETGTPERPACGPGAEKLLRKGCDLLVFNDVSGDRAFGQDDNTVIVYRPADSGAQEVVRSTGTKADVSHDVIAAVIAERTR